MTNQTLRTLINDRDELLGLWQTEREVYGVASDETGNALQEAMSAVSREQRKVWNLRRQYEANSI